MTTTGELTVQAVTRVHVPTLSPDSTLKDAVDKMDLYQVVELLIVDADRRVCGIVSRGDVVRHVTSEPGVPLDQAVRERATDAVSNWMTTSVVSVDARDEALAAAKRMLDKGVFLCPVLEEGRMIGTVCLTDILQGLLARQGS